MRNLLLALLLVAGALVGCGAFASGPSGNHEGADCSAGNGRGPIFGSPACATAPPTGSSNPIGLGTIGGSGGVPNPTVAQAQVIKGFPNSAEGGGNSWETWHQYGADSAAHYSYISSEYASHSGSEPAGSAPYFYFDKEAVYQEGMFWHQGRPLDLSCGPPSSTSLKCTWNRDARNDTGGYNLYNAGSASVLGVPQNGLLAHTASGVTSATLSGLTTGTTVYVYLTTVTVSTQTSTNMPTVGSAVTLTLGSGNTTGIMVNHWVKICDGGGGNCGNEKVSQWTSSTITIGKLLKAHTSCSTTACPITREQMADGFDPLDGITSIPTVVDDGTGFQVALTDTTLLPNTTHEYGTWLSDTANAQGVTAPHGTADATTVQLSNYSATIPSNNPNPPYNVNAPGAQVTPAPGSTFTISGVVDEYNSSSAPTMQYQYNPNCCLTNTSSSVTCTAGTAPKWNCTSGSLTTVTQVGRAAARFCQGSTCTGWMIPGGVNNRSSWEDSGAPEDSNFIAGGHPEAAYTLEQECWQEMNGPQGAFATIPATQGPNDGCRFDDDAPFGPAGAGVGAAQPELSPVDSSDDGNAAHTYWGDTTSCVGGGGMCLGRAGISVSQTIPLWSSLYHNAHTRAAINHNCGNPPWSIIPAQLIYNNTTGGEKFNLCDAWFVSGGGSLNVCCMNSNFTWNGVVYSGTYYNQLQDPASLIWRGESVLLHPIGATNAQRYGALALALILADCGQHVEYRFDADDTYPNFNVKVGCPTDPTQQFVGPCPDTVYANSTHCDFSLSSGYWNATCQVYERHYTYGIVLFAPGSGGTNQTAATSCALGGSYYHLQTDTTAVLSGGRCAYDASPVTTAPALATNTGWIGVDSAHQDTCASH